MPSFLYAMEPGNSLIRLERSNISSQNQHPLKNGGVIKVVDIEGVRSFVKSTFHSIRDFFTGPSGVITKLGNFLNGHNKVSTHFFGRKIDLRANIPLSLDEVHNAFVSFMDKLRTDPMTRMLFAMYLNIVVVLVVFLSLIVKHIQISLKSMQQSTRANSMMFSTHVRTISPDVAMPQMSNGYQQSPVLQDDRATEANTQEMDDKSINWSAIANPSFCTTVNQDTFIISRKNHRLLNDIRGLLTTDQEDEYSRKKFTYNVILISKIQHMLGSHRVLMRQARVQHFEFKQVSTTETDISYGKSILSFTVAVTRYLLSLMIYVMVHRS
ncbi:hypothetical protein DICVIV_13615 [Dictyocaulus viviparus]|uniref:Uncharacterized protein n=1 Tax=Dictyocaulus viviparus TaxID=29172 RepID=A0A0D8XDD0_DICVI|nr:hypothetical protein DICVIV_13615 [Dictyocaulus viviparus]